LKGEFVLISGGAAYYSSRNINRICTLPDFSWKGVIVSYRIPEPQTPIDIYEYIE